MTVVVQLVIGQLELVKRDRLLHPLRPGGGAVRVHVYPWRRHGVGLARHHPARAVEGVPVALVVDRDEVHHQHVLRVQVQAAQLHLEGGEHAAARLGHDHLGTQGVELVPEVLHLEDGAGVGERGRDGAVEAKSIGFRCDY